MTLVLILGSIWGAYELFVRQALASMNVDHKSPYLFAFAIMIMYLSKKMVDFRGSAIVMALIASVYKTFSTDFLACMAAAIVIDGIVFESAWRLAAQKMNQGTLNRTLAALAITFVAYTIFGIYAAYLGPKEFADGAGIRGVITFLTHSGVIAAILAMLTANLGNALGAKLRNRLSANASSWLPAPLRTALLVSVAAFWFIRFLV